MLSRVKWPACLSAPCTHPTNHFLCKSSQRVLIPWSLHTHVRQQDTLVATILPVARMLIGPCISMRLKLCSQILTQFLMCPRTTVAFTEAGTTISITYQQGSAMTSLCPATSRIQLSVSLKVKLTLFTDLGSTSTHTSTGAHPNLWDMLQLRMASGSLSLFRISGTRSRGLVR